MTTENHNNTTFHADGASLTSFVGPGTYTVRSYFSSSHLWAAEHFTELAIEQESSNENRPLKGIQHRAYVTNAILSSVAFLEAAVNELCKDIVDRHGEYINPISEAAKIKISKMWNSTEATNRSVYVLKKYQDVLIFCGKEKINEEDNLYKDVKLTIQLRNNLMHYKPESYGSYGYIAEAPQAINQHSLTEELRDKFDENPLMVGSGNPYFPDKCLGSPCASWAVMSVRNLADEFFQRLSVTPHYP